MTDIVSLDEYRRHDLTPSMTVGEMADKVGVDQLVSFVDIASQVASVSNRAKAAIGLHLERGTGGRSQTVDNVHSLTRKQRHEYRLVGEWVEANPQAEASFDELPWYKLVKAARTRPEPKPAPPLPAGTYSLIYADPPWRYEHSKSDSRAIENQYPTMTTPDIAALTVPAAPDCVLYLWATSPKLEEAFSVLNGWGFTYKTSMVWVKASIGMGYHARNRHELLLIATRGKPGTPAPSDRPDSVIEAPKRLHSQKPDSVYDLIDQAWPAASKLELFARNERPGWDSWGNQL